MVARDVKMGWDQPVTRQSLILLEAGISCVDTKYDADTRENHSYLELIGTYSILSTISLYIF